MKRRPTLQRGPVLRYYIHLRIQTYTEPVPLKYGKLATKIRGYTDIFAVRAVVAAMQSVFINAPKPNMTTSLRISARIADSSAFVD